MLIKSLNKIKGSRDPKPHRTIKVIKNKWIHQKGKTDPVRNPNHFRLTDQPVIWNRRRNAIIVNVFNKWELQRKLYRLAWRLSTNRDLKILRVNLQASLEKMNKLGSIG